MQAIPDRDPEPTLHDFHGSLRRIFRQSSALQRVLTPGVSYPISTIREAFKIAKIENREVCRYLGIIDSMTREESWRPEVINESRQTRIANGAGVKPEEVAALLHNFHLWRKRVLARTEAVVAGEICPNPFP